VVGAVLGWDGQVARAAKVTVDLGNAKGVISVGAFNRWDSDGNPRKAVNTKAKIESPEVDAFAKDIGNGKWVFKDLPAGKYDLLIMLENKVRLEGFVYPPVLEFDPFFPGDAKVENEETRDAILEEIKNQRHYENKVEPLYLGGDDKVIRVLVMLIRDKTTSYEADMAGASTMRFEVWQFDWQYGGWAKNKRTRVLHRVIMPLDQLRQWTWIWDAKLGGIEVSKKATAVEYEVPKPTPESKLKGLYPY
jgi:hypothetical protein